MKNSPVSVGKSWTKSLRMDTKMRLRYILQFFLRKINPFNFKSGDYDLDFESYKLLFSNFLLGKTIYGPGMLDTKQKGISNHTYQIMQENTSLAASTTETLMRPTKSSTTMFEA